jgi:hypothetical protein
MSSGDTQRSSIEFSINDDAVVRDLRRPSGSGLLSAPGLLNDHGDYEQYEDIDPEFENLFGTAGGEKRIHSGVLPHR